MWIEKVFWKLLWSSKKEGLKQNEVDNSCKHSFWVVSEMKYNT